jgi:predicted dehydrogenase
MTSSTPISATVRVAVVGFGARAAIAQHVGAAREGARIVAIVEPDADGRARAQRAYPDAVIHADLDALVAAGDVDAAIVTAPDHAHESIAVTLLDAGIPVYLEKPLAITLEGADRVLDAAARSGTVLYVGHNFRHAAVVRVMREIIERGEIGEVKAVWVRHFVGNGGDYYFKDWHADRTKTGTLLLQKASHDIDVIHHLASGYTRRAR